MTTTTSKSKIKTIDIQAKEWFDKANGNSYFAAIITTDYGTPKEKEYKVPFQYGYGEQYMHEAFKELERQGVISREKYANGGQESIHEHCKRKGVITRANIQKNCKQRELKDI